MSNDSLEFGPGLAEGENTRTPQGLSSQGYEEKRWKKVTGVTEARELFNTF
jgi:hypothetical protein